MSTLWWENVPEIGDESDGSQTPSTAELERLARQLVEKDGLAMSGKLAACIGHELNNQLMISNGNLEVAAMCIREGKPELALDYIQQAINMLQQAASLNQNLFATTQTSRNLVPIQINELFHLFLPALKPLMKKRQILFNFHPSDHLPDILACEIELRQVLFNLIQNALDAGSTAIEIVTFYESRSRMVKSRIRDNGRGITREKLKTLFVNFKSDKESGHGLGLYICREIITRHRGMLTVRSREGVGTEFTLCLPAHASK
jgi:C4-dicarboxylate-specific signal transduction histidine kinase